MNTADKTRCFGNGKNQQLLADYHDKQWGVPVHADQMLFEMLILEGAHAGLSWFTVLKKRHGYQEAFHQFEVQKVATMTDQELTTLLQNPEIIRNRLKVFSARKNAQVFIEIQQQWKTFDNYLWHWVDYKTIDNQWRTANEIPATTPISDQLSKDLKKRGMSFVGSTIIYAYMQSVGLVNDHAMDCWLRQKPK